MHIIHTTSLHFVPYEFSDKAILEMCMCFLVLPSNGSDTAENYLKLLPLCHMLKINHHTANECFPLLESMQLDRIVFIHFQSPTGEGFALCIDFFGKYPQILYSGLKLDLTTALKIARERSRFLDISIEKFGFYSSLS